MCFHVLRGGLLALLPIAGLAAFQSASSTPVPDQFAYRQIRLISDGSTTAKRVDGHLVNPWGLAFDPNGFAWIANNETGVSTIFDGRGNTHAPLVTVPDAGPTGIVFNWTNDFQVNGQPTSFLIATEDGAIDAWLPPGPQAVTAANLGRGAVYKGLAIAADSEKHFLYATDFFNRRIDVWGPTLQEVPTNGGFVDPDLPDGWAPFGIQNIDGDLYVTYVMQDPDDPTEEMTGPHMGLIDAFTPQGNLIRRVVTGGPLNAPWGMAVAPSNFGVFSNRLLVGNFGDGTIDAFDLASGTFMGPLRDSNGQAIVLDGLWALSFGNGVQHQGVYSLYFTAGVGDESGGLYGSIRTMAPAGSD